MEFKAIFIGIFFLIAVSQSFNIPARNAVSRLRRSEANTGTEEKKVCSEQLACQWGVYGDDARKRVSFYIDNKNCICGDGNKCSKAEDNLSMGAYIYRCMPENFTTTPSSSDAN